MTDLDNEQQQQDEDTKEDVKIPKHLRVRYWNNWEEMKLIELWRQNQVDVTTLQRNLPVFRKISEKMRESGFAVNPQECRRKINVLKNKYIAERRRMELSDDYPKSEWKLYPLVHCLLVPKNKNLSLTHQETIISKLLPTLTPLQTDTATGVALKHGICFPGSAPSSIPLAAFSIAAQNSNNQQKTTAAAASGNTPFIARRTYERHFTRNPTANMTTCSPANDGVSYVLQHCFTLARLEQLREDNRRLGEQRDNDLKVLEIETKEYEFFESFLKQWKQQNELVLQRLECRSSGAAAGTVN